MCSIAGYACTRHLADEAIESTLALMRRRGPDHAAYRRFVAPSGRETCLLHSRLSIIDLDPRSSQPFQSGATWLTYNGELYLNAHVHLHLCMLDGVVAQGRQGLVFRGARVDEACVERVQAAVRQRALGLLERRGMLSRETVGVMQGWGHRGGFSVHAGERVAAQDSAGRERLLRY